MIGLLRVPVIFNNISKFALIDTGACASFVSDEYLATPGKAVIKTIENTTLRVFRSASGETMRKTGVYELKVKLSPECEKIRYFMYYRNWTRSASSEWTSYIQIKSLWMFIIIKK